MAFTPAFWQSFLAAEVPSYRAHQIVREIERSRTEPLAYLRSRAKLTPAEMERLREVDDRALERVLAAGARLLWGDLLPPLLDGSPNPPAALFAWGQPEVLHRPAVAIVGTRAATTYGKAVAQKFAESLAGSGLVIVSGGALGVDAAAHKGALAAEGSTIAVLASGIDRVYPSMHGPLFQRIRESGCLVSQFAAGTRTSRYRFLIRNHLVAALSLGVLVVEAPEKSGALVTAHAAVEMGRPVFVVPANVDNLNFRGSHALIRDGAALVDHPDQVLQALGMSASRQQAPAVALTEQQRQIVETLIGDPVSPEIIVSKTGLPPEVVLSELTMLELDGIVIQDLGRYAKRP